MGKSQKEKGSRREREFAQLTGGTKIPLSGAMEGYANDVNAYGLEWEIKSRKTGFKTIYDWVLDERENPDAVAIKVDRKPWLVVMELDKFKELMDR
ncbi:hypothetical protein HXA31_20550 [Salipaludibacillus agaradhaerens]|jgi:hypothetical protein|uniref:Uncharacterized protein n=1 Tax=Salipaludibacillus agaradhaerens TaxID=76935 RepID=A0A9Q4B221_SALAG|nr:hypothetical protein [Salipaludibacillus agaradhaerens]MCR6096879.1 hypothetical protein [Salipaludibacillus agaradhaerens]MCR6116723.1 hypothetical protein [Salipaludibacillus agaradhaerens]